MRRFIGFAGISLMCVTAAAGPAVAQRPHPVAFTLPARTAPPEPPHRKNPLLGPPPADRFARALGTIAITSGLTAAAWVVGVGQNGCDGTCQLVIAAFGMTPGLALGERLVERSLSCEHHDATLRSTIGFTIGSSLAIMALSSSTRAAAVTMLAVTPVTTAYFLSGCDTR